VCVRALTIHQVVTADFLLPCPLFTRVRVRVYMCVRMCVGVCVRVCVYVGVCCQFVNGCC